MAEHPPLEKIGPYAYAGFHQETDTGMIVFHHEILNY